MTATNKHKGIALFLILFLTALSITLANATTEDNYKNTTNILLHIYESTHTENNYKANIIINPHTTGIYAKEDNYKLDLTINPQRIGGSHSENNYKLDLIPEKTFPHNPDIAVTNIALPKTVVGQGYPCKITTTVSNQELHYETFHFTLYANTTTIKTQTITLTSKTHTTNTFIWNTTDVAKGNYTITAIATPVPNEADTTDNTLTSHWIIIAMVGDLNGPKGFPDGLVDIDDVVFVAISFGAYPGHIWWNPNADITNDNIIDIDDVMIPALHFGEIDP